MMMKPRSLRALMVFYNYLENYVLKFLCIFLLATNCLASERIVQQDERGNNLYHKQQYIATHGKMCPISAAGYREYHKPCLSVSKEMFEKLTKDSK